MLRRLGLQTLGTLGALAAPPAAVQAQFGRLGWTLWELAAGRRWRRRRCRGRWRPVAAITEEWLLVDERWREREVRRRYVRLVLVDGRPVTVFCDLVDGRWYRQEA